MRVQKQTRSSLVREKCFDILLLFIKKIVPIHSQTAIDTLVQFLTHYLLV